MDEMINNAEEFYQALGIGYRIVNIVSGVCLGVSVCMSMRVYIHTSHMQGFLRGGGGGEICHLLAHTPPPPSGLAYS